MVDKKKIVMENYFKTDCDINTSIKQAYERGFNRAYEKCMALIKKKPTTNSDTKNASSVRVMDLLWLFSDGYGCVNYSVVEITDGNDTVTFEDFPDLSGEISNYDNCIVTHAYVVDSWLCLSVKEL